MKENGIKTLLFMGLLLSISSVALAREKPELVLTMSAQKEVVVKDQNGKAKTAWIEIQSFEPGEVVRYTIAYKNAGTAEARNAVIIDPIPPGTAYLAESAEGKNTEISFSLDGKAFQVPPMLKYRVKANGGFQHEYSATPEMYTHIKWRLTAPTPPGATGLVSFKVRVR